MYKPYQEDISELKAEYIHCCKVIDINQEYLLDVELLFPRIDIKKWELITSIPKAIRYLVPESLNKRRFKIVFNDLLKNFRTVSLTIKAYSDDNRILIYDLKHIPLIYRESEVIE